MIEKTLPFFDLPRELQEHILALHANPVQLKLVAKHFWEYFIFNQFLNKKSVNFEQIDLMIYWLKEKIILPEHFLDLCIRNPFHRKLSGLDIAFNLCSMRLLCNFPLQDLPLDHGIFQESLAEHDFFAFYTILSSDQQHYLTQLLIKNEDFTLSKQYIHSMHRLGVNLSDESPALKNMRNFLKNDNRIKAVSKKKGEFLEKIDLLAPLLTARNTETIQIVLSNLESKSHLHKIAAWKTVLSLVPLLTPEEKASCLERIPGLLNSKIKKLNELACQALIIFSNYLKIDEKSALTFYVFLESSRVLPPEHIFPVIIAMSKDFPNFVEDHPFIRFLHQFFPVPSNMARSLEILESLAPKIVSLNRQSPLIDNLMKFQHYYFECVLSILKTLPWEALATWLSDNDLVERIRRLTGQEPSIDYYLFFLLIPKVYSLFSTQEKTDLLNKLLLTKYTKYYPKIRIIHHLYCCHEEILSNKMASELINTLVSSWLQHAGTLITLEKLLLASLLPKHGFDVTMGMLDCIAYLSSEWPANCPAAIIENLEFSLFNHPVYSPEMLIKMLISPNNSQKIQRIINRLRLLKKIYSQKPELIQAVYPIDFIFSNLVETRSKILIKELLQFLHTLTQLWPEIAQKKKLLQVMLELVRDNNHPLSFEHLDLIHLWLDNNPVWFNDKQDLIELAFQLIADSNDFHVLELFILLSDFEDKAFLIKLLWSDMDRSEIENSQVLLQDKETVSLIASLLHPGFFEAKPVDELLSKYQDLEFKFDKFFLELILRVIPGEEIKSHPVFLETLLTNEELAISHSISAFLLQIYSKEEIWALLHQKTISVLTVCVLLNDLLPTLSQEQTIASLNLLAPMLNNSHSAYCALNMLIKLVRKNNLDFDFASVFGPSTASIQHTWLHLVLWLKNQTEAGVPAPAIMAAEEASGDKRKRDSQVNYPVKRFRLFYTKEEVKQATDNKPNPDLNFSRGL